MRTAVSIGSGHGGSGHGGSGHGGSGHGVWGQCVWGQCGDDVVIVTHGAAGLLI